MANMREIRSRIKSVKNTGQITKAMKVVAVSKLRRTQASMTAMHPLTVKCQEVIDALLGGGAALENRFITPHKQVKKLCYVVFVGNRGLCGAYNSNLIHFLSDAAAGCGKDIGIVILGRWGKDVFAKSGLPILHSFTEVSDTPSSDQAIEVAEYLKQLFLSGEVDEVHLVYQHYVSALRQEPVQTQLLPARPEHSGAASLDFELVPDPAEVLESAMQLYINNKVFSAMIEAKCGEHSARMTAMTAAADNTKSLIGELELSLNRARQAAITTEISEIVGGASALKRKHNQ